MSTTSSMLYSPDAKALLRAMHAETTAVMASAAPSCTFRLATNFFKRFTLGVSTTSVVSISMIVPFGVVLTISGVILAKTKRKHVNALSFCSTIEIANHLGEPEVGHQFVVRVYQRLVLL